MSPVVKILLRGFLVVACVLGDVVALALWGRDGFALMGAAETGVGHRNPLEVHQIKENVNWCHGSGVAMGDYDGDGLNDLYFCQLFGPNRLYRNLGGWKFEEVSERSGVACRELHSTAAMFVDATGDGRLDLIVGTMGDGLHMYENLGDGRFAPLEDCEGFRNAYGTTSMGAADIDADGDLDLYVANFGARAVLRGFSPVRVSYINSRPYVRGPLANRVKYTNGVMEERGEPDQLFINNGMGQFQEASWGKGRFTDSDGIPLSEAPWEFGLCVMVRDMTGDGSPDIYVGNDFDDPDHFWVNDGNGNFRELSPLNLRSYSRFTMSVDVADVDRDGVDDIFLADMLNPDPRDVLRSHYLPRLVTRNPGQFNEQRQLSQNFLLMGQGGSKFLDNAYNAGVSSTGWSWGGAFMDVNLDGYEDLLIATGYGTNIYDKDLIQSMKSDAARTPTPPILIPNVAFRNNGGGGFDLVSDQWGFNEHAVSLGVALGDLDNDGDADVAVSTLNHTPLLYRNLSERPRLRVKLEGPAGNACGIGARITVVSPSTGFEQSQVLMAGNRYMSSDAPEKTFAIQGDNEVHIKVQWPDGKETKHIHSISDGPLAELSCLAGVGLRETPSSVNRIAPKAKTVGISGMPLHQPVGGTPDGNGNGLIELSRMPDDFPLRGPVLRAGHWFNCPSDNNSGPVGVLLSSAGTSGFLYGGIEYEIESQMLRWSELPVVGSPERGMDIESRDLLILNRGESGAHQLITCDSFGVHEWNLQQDKVEFRKTLTGSSHCLQLIEWDADGDGRPDLLVLEAGHRISDSSRLILYRGSADGFGGPHTAEFGCAVRQGVAGGFLPGSGGDGEAGGFAGICSGGRLVVYRLRITGDEIGLVDMTHHSSLESIRGFWRTIKSGDWNQDGKTDLLLGNLGLNYRSSASRFRPWTFHILKSPHSGLYFNFSGVEYPDPGMTEIPMIGLDEISSHFPLLQRIYKSHKSYADSSVGDILRSLEINPVETFRINESRSMILVNEGTYFEFMPLPEMAQWSTVNGVATLDFNGDTYPDIFLAQNSSEFPLNIRPQDAGSGLILAGGADGNFNQLESSVSGLVVHGDQGEAVALDLNQDGFQDLLIPQFRGPVKAWVTTNR